MKGCVSDPSLSPIFGPCADRIAEGTSSGESPPNPRQAPVNLLSVLSDIGLAKCTVEFPKTTPIGENPALVNAADRCRARRGPRSSSLAPTCSGSQPILLSSVHAHGHLEVERVGAPFEWLDRGAEGQKFDEAVAPDMCALGDA